MSTPPDVLDRSASEEAIELTYRDAITAALDDALATDPTTVLLGEDVASDGGVFKTSVGLVERYGPERVRNTPICENGFVGVALGMSLVGIRPIVEIMFADFLPTAGDAIVNQLPKYRFISGGRLAVPVTVRAICGGTGGFGTQHSATGESWYMGLPGLRVAVAASPGAAYELLTAAIRDPNPTLVFEHKGLYARKGPVRRGRVAPIGQAAVVRDGSDVTIVTSLLMVERALEAARILDEAGVSVEVIDVRWLRPLDLPTIRASVEKTGRLVIAEEQVHAAGWGATVISELTIGGVRWAAPPRRVSLPDDYPIPYAAPLEAAVIPSVDAVADAARAVAADGPVRR